MDTAGAWLLHRTVGQLPKPVQWEGFHHQHQALLAMIQEQSVTSTGALALPRTGVLEHLGRWTIGGLAEAGRFFSFVGQLALTFFYVLGRPHLLRWRSLLVQVHRAGLDALPILALLSFLMGTVIAYQGVDQLGRYGAGVFVVDLTGLYMVREFGPLLAAIIVAGRTGSAFAAEIGTMKATGELDAMRTLGLDPFQLLVLPKVLALILIMPLLTVFSDAVGLAGAMVVTQSLLGLGPQVFLDRLQEALDLGSYFLGTSKAPLFGGLVALAGCYQGFQVVGGAASVGHHTTRSVVLAITLVVFADAAYSTSYTAMGL